MYDFQKNVHAISYLPFLYCEGIASCTIIPHWNKLHNIYSNPLSNMTYIWEPSSWLDLILNTWLSLRYSMCATSAQTQTHFTDCNRLKKQRKKGRIILVLNWVIN